MGRRKGNEGDAVSLFPFMSILVCLIGSLTLMITIQMSGQANSEQSQEEIERYRKYTELKAVMEQDQAELESLKRLLAQAEKAHEEIRLAAQEAALLEKKQQDELQRVGAAGFDKLLAESARLRNRLTEIEADLPKLQKTVEELEKEIQRRKAGPEEAVVQIRPGGSGLDIVPTFVECTAGSVVVLEGKEPLRIRTADLNKEGGDFHKLLDRVAGTPKGQIILLVRPDAVGTFNVARDVARTHFGPNGYCKTGKLPVPTQGKIDLNVFRR
ncbi:MAG: hypothetical protein A2V98_16020 [Planctomycetes bacterium RBG_16_64_12]|nr:MAG: hypothetical protein A2V98_16020 [Planctomycetes bacterium RBG_16_64_12]